MRFLAMPNKEFNTSTLKVILIYFKIGDYEKILGLIPANNYIEIIFNKR
jgi:hypothetical protein